MIECDVLPATDGADGTLLVLLHGRGADRQDMRSIATQLPRGWTAVVADAPHPAAPWGYGPGRAWYQFLGGNRPEPESFRISLHALDELLDHLNDTVGFKPEKLVLGGFSQGGTLSLGYALSRAGRVTHVLNFSGFLADHPDVRVTPETVRNVRIFWGHGFSDANIPFTLAREGQQHLTAAGAQLEARDYPIGHWIDPLELAHAVAFVEAGA